MIVTAGCVNTMLITGRLDSEEIFVAGTAAGASSPTAGRQAGIHTPVKTASASVAGRSEIVILLI
jgi:hypothetical protein